MDRITAPVIRSIVTDDEFGGFRITIPPPDIRWTGGCLLAILAMLAPAFALTVLYILSDPGQNLRGGMTMLGVWTVVGLLVAGVLIQTWTHREVIMIEAKALVVRSECAGYSRSRTFDLAGLRNLRPGRRPDGVDQLAVLFEHGGQSHYFGSSLSEHEIVRLVKTIRSRLPIRDDWNDVEPLPVVH